ncbi:MAG: hypothetical protein K1X88_04470 [Nannocystaceae bacterium]|nr:hypothetical protein [Nannocystaceae bacterium]
MPCAVVLALACAAACDAPAGRPADPPPAPDREAAAGCVGDDDGSGTVDSADLLQLLAQWGPCEACSMDTDGNGAVDSADLLQVIAAWGPCGWTRFDADALAAAAIPTLASVLADEPDRGVDDAVLAQWLDDGALAAIPDGDTAYRLPGGATMIPQAQREDFEQATAARQLQASDDAEAELARFETAIEHGLVDPDSPMMAAAAQSYRAVAEGTLAPEAFGAATAAAVFAGRPAAIDCAFECGLTWYYTAWRAPQVGRSTNYAAGGPRVQGRCAGSSHALWPEVEARCDTESAQWLDETGTSLGNGGALRSFSDSQERSTHGCLVDVRYELRCTVAQRRPGACRDVGITIAGHETMAYDVHAEASRDDSGTNNGASAMTHTIVSLGAFDGKRHDVPVLQEARVGRDVPTTTLLDELECVLHLMVGGELEVSGHGVAPSGSVGAEIECELPLSYFWSDDDEKHSHLHGEGSSDVVELPWSNLATALDDATGGRDDWAIAYGVHTDFLGRKHVEAGIHAEASSDQGSVCIADPEGFSQCFDTLAGAAAEARIAKARGGVVIDDVHVSNSDDLGHVAVELALPEITFACDDPRLFPTPAALLLDR